MLWDHVFQFHYGTIGRYTDKSIEFDFKVFQFHYGTIGSLFATISTISKTLFQFHYGTIGRNSYLNHLFI